MARHATRRSEAQTDPQPSTPPRPTGDTCRQCGAYVLVRVYANGAYVELARPVSPVLGQEHTCEAKGA